MANFADNQQRSLEAFNTCVKDKLQALLSGEIYSIEEQARTSTIAALMDQGASSDLLISLKANGLLYSAASRIRFIKKDDLKYDFSIQLRNQFKSSCYNTELNKLDRLIKAFESGIPVILPRYLCYSRVMAKEKGFELCDLVAVETIPLVKMIFAFNGINLPKLRQKFNSMDKTANGVFHCEKNIWYAGIRPGDDNSFLFLSRMVLDDFSIPYLYFDMRKNIEKKEGGLNNQVQQS